MSAQTATRQQLIKRIQRVGEQQLPPETYSGFLQFAEQVLHVHPDDDQLDWQPESNFGVLFGLYRFASSRPQSKPLLKVFNPSAEEDGWSSKHTVIYYCQDDMPFLVDSLRMALNHLGMGIQLFESSVISLSRDNKGDFNHGSSAEGNQRESVGYILIDHSSEDAQLRSIHNALTAAMADVALVVGSFEPMLQRVDSCIAELEQQNTPNGDELAFLRWLRDGNFTFLGMAEFRLSGRAGQERISEEENQRLGLMTRRDALPTIRLKDLGEGFEAFYRQDHALAFTKSSQRSTVHRSVYADYVIVKRFDQKGRAVGETRILGLYTSGLYFQSIDQIPLLRSKAHWLCQHSQLDNASHNGKTFRAIIQGHPRDELLQASNENLLETALGIWKIYERRAVRLFARVDHFEKFVSFIVYLPREAVNAETEIHDLLAQAMGTQDGERSTQFMSESVLARLHFIFRIADRNTPQFDVAALEHDIRELTRDWSARFYDLCLERLGDERGRLIGHRFWKAFPAAYRDRFSPLVAVNDLELCMQLKDRHDISISLFRELGAEPNTLRLKLCHREESLQLSDIMPLLENLGSRVLVEHPYQIRPVGESDVWMHDFSLEHDLGNGVPLNLDTVRDSYQEALRAIWRGQAENDVFNRLVFGARLDWRTVALIRAYARYLKQLGSPFSLEFVATVLAGHVSICRDLVALFRCLFDPRRREKHSSDDRIAKIRRRIIAALDKVANLNEDQVLRQYMQVIEATLRTNFFQTDESGEYRDCIALKISTSQLEFAPQPRPEFEVYVFSPRVEGVHLRGGKVARGGIRWSDRLEDFRTEILGLVKAQQVKNAVIVPTGAKGGFVARRAPQMGTREQLQEEGVACYRLFIGSLLDITDNRIGEGVERPNGVVCRDEEDPYLVVAADKGTASFSDIANEISLQHNFWLGDAFASGGSNGYDHKAMGITARGAWVAVQRHFRELGKDIQSEEFTALGIGDMGGDVFGNGMLLSKHTRLVAAFNHMHIFIDPEPDAEASWAERKRLFDLPRSSWADYNSELISKGGGVFERSAKQINLSAQMRKLLDCKDKALSPDALIKRLMQAPVDLIWNGGIGTYVKSNTESHADVGDRANDGVRVNGRDLRCKVFGEGGNLGLTQLGRMEYCREGGICNTDFIDNAAGVDCSDHEVNIKILLNAKVESEDLTAKQRNQLLSKMTDDVADLVLENNYRQTLAISLAENRRAKHHHDYLRFLEHLEETGRLHRDLEFLPDNETIKDYYGEGKAWTRPELSVMVSYAKVELKEQLLSEEIVGDDWIARRVFSAFPARLQKKYGQDISHHRLQREIIATQLANEMVNLMGFSYSLRQSISVGARPPQTAMAFVTVMELFELGELWQQVEALDYAVPTELQYELFHQIMRLGRRGSRWFLRNKHEVAPQHTIELMKKDFQRLMPEIPDMQGQGWSTMWQQRRQNWIEQGVPEALAGRIAAFDAFYLLPGGVDAALTTEVDAHAMMSLQFDLVELLSLDWMFQRLIDWQPDSRWQDLARESYVDNIEVLLRSLAVGLSQYMEGDSINVLASWQSDYTTRIDRYLGMINALRASATQDLSVFTVIVRELQDLVDASLSGLAQSS